MGQFIKAEGSLVNKDRLVAVQHKPAENGGAFVSREHYLAVFDTGEKIWLSPTEGRALIEQCQATLGTIATTSESAM